MADTTLVRVRDRLICTASSFTAAGALLGGLQAYPSQIFAAMTKAKSKSTSKEPSLGTRVSNSYLALKILLNPKITFAKTHVSGKVDDANSDDNIIRTLLFKPAKRSSYQNAPGGTAYLDERMLQGMLDLADKFSFHVSEIAGGSHSKGSRHYAGIGFDVTQINGNPVSAGDKTYKAFMNEAKALGATEVLGPGSDGHSGHVHVAWPRH